MASGGVVIQQPTTVSGVAVHNNVNSQSYVTATKGLGIAQIVLGAATILFGIIVAAVLHYWMGSVGFGIWGGIWVRYFPYHNVLLRVLFSSIRLFRFHVLFGVRRENM